MSIDALLTSVSGNKLATVILLFGATLVSFAAVASSVEQVRWWVYRSELSEAKDEINRKFKERAEQVDKRDADQEKKISDIQCNVLFSAITGGRQTIRDIKADLEKNPNVSLYRELDKYQDKLRLDQARYDRECNK